MSRWGKNNVIVPLDTLINKEKENTNRPIAARSCGTVGRWGKMGFTSTRTYALKAIPSSLSPGQSPEIGRTPTGAGTAVIASSNSGATSPISEAPVPKPKKFFKSRNTTAPLDLLRTQFMQHHMSNISPIEPGTIINTLTTNHKESNVSVSSAGNLKIKIKKRVERKKSTSPIEKPEKEKQEKRKKEKDDKKKEKDDKKKEKDDKKKDDKKKEKEKKEERKKDEKKIKQETAPSRILGRNRKAINYNEDDDSIPYRNSAAMPKNQALINETLTKSDDETEISKEIMPANTIMASPPSSVSFNKSSSGIGNCSVDHPPIVLRISKGTSRLISTDSEEQQNSSPGHHDNSEFSPPHPIKNNFPPPKVSILSLPASPGPAISTTEELLSVLSGEPTNNSSNLPAFSPPSSSANQISEINYEAKISPDKPPKERLKLIIKTDVLKKALAAERAEKAEKTKKNKKHHHHHHHSGHHHKSITLKLSSSDADQFKTPSPQPGTDNYDLYKQLTISPSERDFDSQSSVLGSISSKDTTRMGINGPLAASAVPEDICVIRSRGSSDVTSDLETSQHSSLVAPPSDIESRLESMMDNEDDNVIHDGRSGKNINIKLKLLTQEEEPLQEDILEVLTGSNEKENVTINKKIIKNELPKITIKSPQTQILPSRRMTRGRKNVTVDDSISQKNEIESAKVEKKSVENLLKKSPSRTKRITKKAPLSEPIKETIKENQLVNEELSGRGKKVPKVSLTASIVTTTNISPIKEIVVERRKRGQKTIIEPILEEIKIDDSVIVEKTETKEEKSKLELNLKENKPKALKEVKLKELTTKNCRGRRTAASLKATADENKPTQIETLILTTKRGRPTRNNNNNNNGSLKTFTSSATELTLEKTISPPKIGIIVSNSSNTESSKPIAITPIKSYGSRKRKLQQPQKEVQLQLSKKEEAFTTSPDNTNSIDLPGNLVTVSSLNDSATSIHQTSGVTDSSIESTPSTDATTTNSGDIESISPKKKEYKINKFKRAWYERDTKNNLENEQPQKLIVNKKIDTDNSEPLNKKPTPKETLNNSSSDSKLTNLSKTNVNKINNKIIVNNNIINSTSTNAETTTAYNNNSTDEKIKEVLQKPQNSTINSNNSVKLVISKKKGSIFKSRALVAEQGIAGTAAGLEKKRHIYKHTWDAENATQNMEFETKTNKNSQKANGESIQNLKVVDSIFDDFNDEDDDNDDDEDDDEPLISHKMNRVARPISGQTPGKFFNDNSDQMQQASSNRFEKKSKEYYTVVRNVKAAHQIQEIGEYQEMDDDVEYILDALQPHNPIPTRCLSALQLAAKCMIPAFRMHVRAHGTVTKFFKALRDAKNDISLGLCTTTIMFVLAQDTLNIDLDRDSLELMMNLLEVDVVAPTGDLTNFERNKTKIRELCEDIKGQGKGAHLNIDDISVGTLAMETLLSLTSKKAGDWFKEELRELGGLEHIIKTICDCCHQISDYVVNWTDNLLDKLKTIERCLRVLENVSELNESNQKYILTYKKGHAVNTLFKLYKLCDSEIALYPTTDLTPKDNPGVVLREALVPTLKVLINLTHPFNVAALGSSILGERTGIFDTSFHILLQAPNYVPERCIFELGILVLLLLINLTMHTIPNRKLIMQSHAPSDFGNQFDKVPAIKALIEYFYRCEEQARLAELNTDAILENPKKNKTQSKEEVDETVTKLLQKAGHHMEHTLQASYAGILIGHLISDSKENEIVIRSHLKENSFNDIINILEKYYNFMNLTASSEANVVSHIKSTKKLIDYFKLCDSHSNNIKSDDENIKTNSRHEPTPSTSVSTRSTPRVYKTYSQR